MEGRTPYWDLKRKIVFDHLEKFKETPSNTIAKILYRDFPEYFISKEAARTYIRRYRGTLGKKGRDKVTIKKYYV